MVLDKHISINPNESVLFEIRPILNNLSTTFVATKTQISVANWFTQLNLYFLCDTGIQEDEERVV